MRKRWNLFTDDRLLDIYNPFFCARPSNLARAANAWSLPERTNYSLRRRPIPQALVRIRIPALRQDNCSFNATGGNPARGPSDGTLESSQTFIRSGLRILKRWGRDWPVAFTQAQICSYPTQARARPASILVLFRNAGTG
ncbi:hypothetical protein K438DRAFT_2082250 [Mycena galopus ATCC 62051]|nr:hypothetical protein K438DRAFT_2082250 [Mycena galopus ATCC 62051]